MNKGERIAGVIPAPAGLYAKFAGDGEDSKPLPVDRVIALVVIEGKLKDGTPYAYLDGFTGDMGIDGGLLCDVGNFAGFEFQAEARADE